MEPLITIALLVGFCTFAIAPAWMPSIKLFLALTAAFYGASVAALALLPSKATEGPEFMGLAILFSISYFLFVLSCAARLVRIGMNVYARKKRANG